MPHSLNQIWIHAVWSTKDRLPLIIPEIEESIYTHMYGLFENIHCPAKIINGMPNHVHCLFSLHRNISISQVVKNIKGNTSHWINEQKLSKDYFGWQVGYSSYSISQSHLSIVNSYITDQKRHHLRNDQEIFQEL